MVAKYFQSRASLDYGVVLGICNDYENISRHYLLWLQGSSWHLRSVHGHWGILRPDGGNLGSSSP